MAAVLRISSLVTVVLVGCLALPISAARVGTRSTLTVEGARQDHTIVESPTGDTYIRAEIPSTKVFYFGSFGDRNAPADATRTVKEKLLYYIGMLEEAYGDKVIFTIPDEGASISDGSLVEADDQWFEILRQITTNVNAVLPKRHK